MVSINVFLINIFFETVSFFSMAVFLRLFFNYRFKYQIVVNILIGIAYGTLIISLAALLDRISYSGALGVFTELSRMFFLLAVETLFLYIILRINVIKLYIYNVFFVMISGIGNAVSFLVFKSLGISTDYSYVTSNVYTVIFGQVITNLFILLTLFAIYFFKAYKFINIKSRFTVLTILGTFGIFAINMGVYLILLRQHSLNMWYFIVIFVLLTAYGLMIIYFLKKFRYYEDRETELNQQVFYNNSLKNTMDGFRRYRHNYNNNLMVITSMLKMDKIRELKAYMDELIMFNNKINSESVLLNVNNAALHGLIMSKAAYAEKMNVTLKISVIGTVEDIKEIKMLELCEILGILLDNAIEAVYAKDVREVELIISKETDMLKFVIKNYFDGGTEEYNTVLIGGTSSKGSGRGNGIKIIKEIVKQNRHVLFNTYLFHDEKILCQEILIVSSPS